MKMCDAGKMPMKTCCASSTFAGALAAEVDASVDVGHVTWGLRDVQTTYLCNSCVWVSRIQGEHLGNAPSIPHALDLLVPRSVSLECVDLVADLEGHDVSVHEVLVSGSVGVCGKTCLVRHAGVPARWRERVDGVAIDEPGEGLPYSATSRIRPCHRRR